MCDNVIDDNDNKNHYAANDDGSGGDDVHMIVGGFIICGKWGGDV